MKNSPKSPIIVLVFSLMLLAALDHAPVSGQSHYGPGPQSESIRQMEADIVAAVNAVRIAHKRPPLRVDPILSDFAREYSRSVLPKMFSGNGNSAGGTIADRLAAVDLRFKRVGENLAMTRSIQKPAQNMVSAWMERPAHRENILEAAYSDIGVGIRKETGSYYFSLIFLQPWGEQENPQQGDCPAAGDNAGRQND